MGIFGGSFNPPHLAHLIIAETVRDRSGLDRILWVPNRRPPHKEGPSLAPARHRYEMTRQAVDANPAFEVSDVELRRAGVSYTVDTVRMLQEAHPDDTFTLIIGSDSLHDFGTWHAPDEIARRVPLLVYKRPGSLVSAVEPRFAGRVRFTDAPLLEISGTEIRARLAAGRSIRYLVPEPVRRYIDAHGLYR